MMCKIRGLGFAEDKGHDRDEKITHNIKKHIYINHSISVIHLKGRSRNHLIRTNTSMTMTTTTSRKMTTIGIFVSSVQKELNEERAAIRDYIKTDPLLRIYFEPFLFEHIPATDREPEELYLSEVDGCSIYLGIFGNEYGPENKQGHLSCRT